MSYSEVNVFVSNLNDFFLTSRDVVGAGADVSTDNAVVVAVETFVPGGSFIVGMVERLQFKVNAAKIDDFLLVAIDGVFSFCEVIFE